jgi:hypothetical protein
MDPNATLRRILEAARAIIEAEDSLGDAEAATVAALEGPELAAAVINLHTWIKKGGFLPREWTSPAES